MSDVQNRSVNADEEGMRLDRWFKRHYPELGHTKLERMLRKGEVRVDGSRAKAGLRVQPGQTIRVPPLPANDARPPRQKTTQGRLSAEDQRFVRELVIYEDDEVIVLNKPAGLAVQGGTRTHRHVDRLLDGLQSRSSERPRLVHRLDKDTSGVLVLARSVVVTRALTKAFSRGEVRKCYWALTVGVPKPLQGTISGALVKAQGISGEKVIVTDPSTADARHAVTHYAVISHAGRRFAWVALRPETGRTHQLRVHCAAIETPIVGDGKYGGAEAHPGEGFARQLHLHAQEIDIPLMSGKRLVVNAPLPNHMRESFALLGFEEAEAGDPFAALDGLA